MEKLIANYNECFTKLLNYNCINEILKKNNYPHVLRNNKNGITLQQLLEYQSNYSLINTKKQNIISNLNFNNSISHYRSSFYKKEKIYILSFMNC